MNILDFSSFRYTDPKEYFRLHPEEPVILATDLDEVCFDYLGDIRKRLVLLGQKPPEGQASSWDLVKAGWFGAQEEFLERHAQAVSEGLYRNLLTLPGAREFLWELVKAGYENNIITSRFVVSGQHERVVSDTAYSLDANKIPYSSLMFQKRKSRFVADAYVDDGPHNIIALREEERFAILVRQIYNAHIEEGPIAENWAEIREILFERFGR